MALKKREKMLAIASAVLVTLLAARFLFSGSATTVGALRADRDRLAGEIQRKKNLKDRADRMFERLAEWQRRSLPTDQELASSLYQNWLMEMVAGHKFQRARVEAGKGRQHHNIYVLYPFTVRGVGSMEQLTGFLHDFYSSGTLHQIRHLSMKPVEKSQDLDITLTIEALALPGADRHDKLSAEPSKRLAHAQLSEYTKVIVARRLFSPFAPPATVKIETKVEPPPAFDVTRFAYLTAVLEVDGQPQIWLRSRTTDDTFKLCQGQSFQVGTVRATVARIGRRDVELEIDGSRHLVPLGSNLREATSPPDAQPKSEPGAPAKTPADAPAKSGSEPQAKPAAGSPASTPAAGSPAGTPAVAEPKLPAKEEARLSAAQPATK